MEPHNSIMIIAIIILLMLSAFFSSAETSLMTVSRIKIRSLADEGNKRAKTVLKILDNSQKMLSAILIGNNIVNIFASSLTTLLVQNLFGNELVSVATGLLTVLVLIFGEITPKTLATQKAETIALAYSSVIYALMYILTPVIFIVNKLASAVMFLFGVDPNKKTNTITETELRTIVDVSHEEGVIESDERQMIKNVFDFGDTCAKDVMIPRIDMCVVDINSTYDELIQLFKENKYTRFPIFSETTDNIVGIINVKDILLYKSVDEFNIKNYLRQPYFTHEHKNLSDLMLEMKKASVNITIVLDEYGAATGLITLEDLIEEIVGEIRDEYDYDEEDSIKEINENEYLIEGQMNLSDINEILDTSLISDDYDSIGGFIMEKLDRLAVEGDTVETKEATLVVDKIEKNRIDKVHLYIHPEDTEESSDN